MKRGALIALLVIIVILLGLFILGGFIYLQFNQEPYVPQKAYLKIDLGGPLAETAPTRFLGMPSGALSIHDLWFQLERAARDERIKGVVLRVQIPLILVRNLSRDTAAEIAIVIKACSR